MNKFSRRVENYDVYHHTFISRLVPSARSLCAAISVQITLVMHNVSTMVWCVGRDPCHWPQSVHRHYASHYFNDDDDNKLLCVFCRRRKTRFRSHLVYRLHTCGRSQISFYWLRKHIFSRLDSPRRWWWIFHRKSKRFGAPWTAHTKSDGMKECTRGGKLREHKFCDIKEEKEKASDNDDDRRAFIQKREKKNLIVRQSSAKLRVNAHWNGLLPRTPP